MVWAYSKKSESTLSSQNRAELLKLTKYYATNGGPLDNEPIVAY